MLAEMPSAVLKHFRESAKMLKMIQIGHYETITYSQRHPKNNTTKALICAYNAVAHLHRSKVKRHSRLKGTPSNSETAAHCQLALCHVSCFFFFFL